MRGDRISNPDGWEADEWMPLPGPGEHRVRFWLTDDPERLTVLLSGHPVEGRVVGMEVLHLREDGVWCGGYLAEDTPQTRRWEVRPSGHRIVSLAPLHIEPSLACGTCPSHGWVHNGNWVGA